MEGITRWATAAHGEFDTSAGNHWSKKVPEDGVWSILVNQKGWHEREEILHRPGNIPWSKFPVGKGNQHQPNFKHILPVKMNKFVSA